MGTHGYSVYRYNGIYFIQYHHWDAYPRGLGVQVKNVIPDDQSEYQLWLEDEKAERERDLRDNPISCDEKDSEQWRSSEASSFKDDVSWIYEIDLDHEVFLVDNFPLFSLRNMPQTEDLFCRCIGFNHYGHRSYKSFTPMKCRYNWTAPPPAVPQQSIAAYDALNLPVVDINAFLGVACNAARPGWESARIALYEVLVGGKMQSGAFGQAIHTLETATSSAAIPEVLIAWGQEILHLGFGPMRFIEKDQHVFRGNAHDGRNRVWQISSAPVYVQFATHLNDERNLKKCILELLSKLPSPAAGCSSFGVLFSFFHCAIVERRAAGGVRVTAPLQFLPSLYDINPSTPGIEAIARLGLRIITQSESSAATTLNSRISKSHILNTVPSEILHSILWQLPAADLNNLVLAAPSIFAANVQFISRYPYINEYRLEGAIASPPVERGRWDIPDDGADFESPDETSEPCFGSSVKPHPGTCTRRFSAMYLGGRRRVYGHGYGARSASYVDLEREFFQDIKIDAEKDRVYVQREEDDKNGYSRPGGAQHSGQSSYNQLLY
ncbi:hypothetical protein HMN09_01310800 [Mycena chlorophos]|uniref:F-box domain-containing protein n=1 Tax=Mycena chlorophos TaxID=658473 RepID=A0A8H6VQ78_MYCCL|nr:hypothetical protein HMN09_01310800 [Mycena chlorophos]